MRHALCLILLGSVGLTPVRARAQTGGNIDLNAFRGAVDSRGYVTANASQPVGRGELSFGLVTSWGFRVLELATAEAVYSVENVITPARTTRSIPATTGCNAAASAAPPARATAAWRSSCSSGARVR